MIKSTFLGIVAAALAVVAPPDPAAAREGFIILQSTTSTRNSGLFDHILPMFFGETGIEVRVVAVGTGQAIRNAANGDGDVLLVHARPAEEQFVAEGHGVARANVMYSASSPARALDCLLCNGVGNSHAAMDFHVDERTTARAPDLINSLSWVVAMSCAPLGLVSREQNNASTASLDAMHCT